MNRHSVRGQRFQNVSIEQGAALYLTCAHDNVHIHAPDRTAGLALYGDYLCGQTRLDGKKIVPLKKSDAIETRGIMIDASRGGVPSCAWLRDLLEIMALNGLNMLMLYTEDTYTVPSEPLFGYGRGAYTFEELHELDDYAAALGIEIVPCIQLLGHFEQFLRYEAKSAMRDNPRVLNLRTEATYTFIARLVEAATKPFRSKRIHVGMDEPWGLGHGKAFDADDYLSPGSLFAQYLAFVNTFCQENGYQVMFWGDYLLGDSGEKALSDEQLSFVPRTLTPIFWEYDCTDQAAYTRRIKKLRALGFEPAVAPAAHTHGRFFPDYDKFERTALKMVAAARKNHVSCAILTLWGDDGHECLNTYALPEIIRFAMACRGLDDSEAACDARLTRFAGMSSAQARYLSRLTEPGIAADKTDSKFAITGKMFLWDDPFYRFIFRMISDPEAAGIVLGKLASAPGVELKTPHLRFAHYFISILNEKVRMLTRLSRGWASLDTAMLSEAIRDFSYLERFIEEAHSLYRELWKSERKMNGIEVIDQRFAQQMNRLKILKATLFHFCNGEISTIPELNDNAVPGEISRNDLYFYNRIFTRCYQLWN